MKYVISCIILFAMVIASNAQKDKKNKIMEKFDFKTANKYPEVSPIGKKRNGWIIVMYRGNNKNSGGCYNEYPPMPTYYNIQKLFYPNGNIKSVTKFVGQRLLIGEMIFYDEKGNITKTVDNNAQFGKFKVEDILKFIKKEGHINLRTGAGLARARIDEEDGYVSIDDAIFDIYGEEYNGKKCYLIQIYGRPSNRSPEVVYYLDKDTGEVLFKGRNII